MKSITHIFRHMIRVATVVGVIGVMLFAQSPQVFADWTQDDAQAIYNNWPGWVVDDNLVCPGSPTQDVSNSGSNAGSTTGAWSSGQSPPYILESFFIEVLKDIAQKRGVNQADAVTEEHVVALVAFAIGEGGDTTNSDLYNPLNTGIDAPDLLDGPHSTNGKQSFKSFDAGVEATARVMVGNNQNRLGNILMKKDSTAQQFMHALTYYTEYTDNKVWAEASKDDPSTPNVNETTEYYNRRLQLIEQVRNDWAGSAGLVIGTPAFEGKTNTTFPSKLVFHPQGASAGAANSGLTTNAAGDVSCLCNQGPNTGGNNNVIVIDPGHSGGGGIKVTDPATGIVDSDYENEPEMKDVFNVAMKVREKLLAAGYKVIFTKGGENPKPNNDPNPDYKDKVSLRGRADVANNAHAALAISIHTDNSQRWANQNNLTYPQAMNLYRETPAGKKVYFKDLHPGGDSIANSSIAAANILSQERTKAEGHTVSVNNERGGYAVTTIDGRGLAPGNIWMVQLFSNVPWVYNEAGGNSAGMTGLSDADQTKYADGLVNGIKRAVPVQLGGAAVDPTAGQAGAPVAPVGCNGSTGKFMDVVKAYAWPTHHNAPYVEPYKCNPEAVSDDEAIKCGQKMKPAYLAAVKAAQTRHDYVGGGRYPGVDCGGFVTLVFHDSGADKDYNKYKSDVVSQRRYLDEVSSGANKKYEKHTEFTSVGQLRPGDIFINKDASHTYLFVGEGVFQGYNSASASFSTSGLSWRTPMASNTTSSDVSSGTWYRPLFPLN